MIGVLCKAHQRDVAEEFFQLLKVPWKYAESRENYEVLLITDGSKILPQAKHVMIFLITSHQQAVHAAEPGATRQVALRAPCGLRRVVATRRADVLLPRRVVFDGWLGSLDGGDLTVTTSQHGVV